MERFWFSSSAQRKRAEGNSLLHSKSRLARHRRLKCTPALMCLQLPNKSGNAAGHHHKSRARPVRPLYEQLTLGLPKPLELWLALGRSRQQRCRAFGPKTARGARGLSCRHAPQDQSCPELRPLGSRNPLDLKEHLGFLGVWQQAPKPVQLWLAQFIVNAPVLPTWHPTTLGAAPGRGQPPQAFGGPAYTVSTPLVKGDPILHTPTHTPRGGRFLQIRVPSAPAKPSGTLVGTVRGAHS